jgi:hypothetical protein
MRFGEHVGRLHHPLDLSRRHRRCAVCGGGGFSWVLTNDGHSICTACYRDIQPRVTGFESENGGDLPCPKGISNA